MQDEAFELRHVGGRDAVLLPEVGERAQHPAQRVAQLAVGLDEGLEDLRPDAQVVGVVRRRDPQPEDVGARLLDHVLRRGDVAERLRHLLALLVEDEAVGQDDVEGRPAAGAAALDQRRMEPAPVLVRALEIHHRVGPALEPAARLEVVADLEREGVRRARVEPDVEHHPDLLVGGRIVAEGREEPRRRVGRKPGVRPLRLEGGGDRLVDALVLEDAVGAALDEDRDRRAPGALARDHPVGLRLDHAGDPVLPLRRHPLHRLDRGKGAMAQRIPLDRRSPCPWR